MLVFLMEKEAFIMGLLESIVKFLDQNVNKP